MMCDDDDGRMSLFHTTNKTQTHDLLSHVSARFLFFSFTLILT